MTSSPPTRQIQIWPIERLVFYARNPRNNDAAVDRMCASIREFGFKFPVLARSDGGVVDGHLRLKAARKLGSWPGGDTTQIPVILCDEWCEAQVRAFRLLVNRATWAAWDEDSLALELQDLNAADYDLSLSGFDPGEIDGLLAIPDEERANAVPRDRAFSACPLTAAPNAKFSWTAPFPSRGLRSPQAPCEPMGVYSCRSRHPTLGSILPR